MPELLDTNGKRLLTLPQSVRCFMDDLDHQVLVVEKASFAGVDLANANFERAMLTEVDFARSILNSACFDHGVLNNCGFDDCIAEGCFLAFSTLKNVSCARADFYWASFFSSTWNDCNLDGADLRASIRDSTFEYCNFVGANFSLNNLGGKTPLEQSKFHECEFIDADLSGAHIQNCEFHGSTYSAQTRFPKGFDPERHRMKLR